MDTNGIYADVSQPSTITSGGGYISHHETLKFPAVQLILCILQRWRRQVYLAESRDGGSSQMQIFLGYAGLFTVQKTFPSRGNITKDPSISIINPFIPVNIYAIYLVLNGWWIHKFSATASPHGVPEAWTAPIWETSQWAAIALTLGVVDQLVGCWSSYPTRFSCGWLNLVDE